MRSEIDRQLENAIREIRRAIIQPSVDQSATMLDHAIELIASARIQISLSMPSEHRAALRSEHLAATVLRTIDGKAFECGIVDVSAGGACLMGAAGIPAKAMDAISLDLPWLAKPVECIIRVKRGDTLHVAFADLTPDEQLTLEKVVESDFAVPL